jgi:hypothetical protein
MRRKPEEQIIGTAQFSRIRRQRLAVVRKIQAEGDMIREVLREPMRDWIDDWLTRGETEDQKDRAARALVDVYMDSWREGELYVLEGDGLRAVKGMADEIPVSADLKEYDFRSRVGILLLDVQPFVETVHFREKGAEDLHFAGLMWSIIPEAEIGAAGRLLLYVLVSDPEGNPILYPPASWDYRLGSPIGENESEDFWTDYAFRFFFSAIQFMQQEIALVGPPKPDRADRRRAARRKTPEEDLTVITLRRFQDRKHHERNGDGWGISYRHLRRGHWARQPHGPQNSLRKWIWRGPIIVGDPSLPLKPFGERLFDVCR